MNADNSLVDPCASASIRGLFLFLVHFVYVNSKRAVSVWCPPYRLDIGALLHPGQITIRIVVANLAINELAKGPLPDYKALNAKYGERFQPQDMSHLEPQPSGILGPVRLTAR